MVNIYGIDKAQKIIREVSLMVKNTDYRATRWTLQLDRSQGVLEVFGLIAQIGPDKITFYGGSAQIIQPIPYVYDVKQVCARTGQRRFLFAGPRDMECNLIHVPRELNPIEIAHVQQNLMSKVVGTENQLMGNVQRMIE